MLKGSAEIAGKKLNRQLLLSKVLIKSTSTKAKRIAGVIE
jgi:hypothetical protein